MAEQEFKLMTMKLRRVEYGDCGGHGGHGGHGCHGGHGSVDGALLVVVV